MRIAVTGSVATDHLMSFPGRFTEQLLADQLDRVSLSFLVEDLQVRRGGVAANICFGLGQLGVTPLLVAAVGEDFTDYRAWLDRHGVDTTGVHVDPDHHSARFVCTTDRDQNQIASFYPGAMSSARDIELGPLGHLDLVVVSPNDPVAMVRHTAECRERGIPFAADPSQQLATLEPDQIRTLVDGAAYLLTNDYESGLVQHKTGWSAAEIAGRVGIQVTTHGPDGVLVEGEGTSVRVPAVPASTVADPTGVGDAFRAGFLAARTWGCGLERAAQVGCVLATLCLESVGPQEYSVAAFAERFAATYGPDAAADVRAHLPGAA